MKEPMNSTPEVAADTATFITLSYPQITATTTTQTDLTSAQRNASIAAYPDMSGYSSSFFIPGLVQALTKDPSTGAYLVSDRMIPQAICEVEGYILISAYDPDEKYNSVLYVLSAANRRLITTLILPIIEHCGGISYDTKNYYLWVCAGNTVKGFLWSSFRTLLTTVTEGSLIRGFFLQNFTKSFAVKTTASFSAYFDGLLWVGQFSDTSVQDIFAYQVNLSSGLTPVYIMEAPKKTQGLAFYKKNNTVFLAVSTSWGRKNDSTLIIYRPSYSSPQTVSGQTYKRILKNDRVTDKTFAPLAEGLSMGISSLTVIFESGAKKYRSSTKNPLDLGLVYPATVIFPIS